VSFREPHSCGSSSGHVTYTAGKTRPLVKANWVYLTLHSPSESCLERLERGIVQVISSVSAEDSLRKLAD